MIILGLTGSIGMGKSTTSKMFEEEGIPVYDADAAVHELYDKGGMAVPIIGELFPGTIVDGSVDREKLSAQVVGNEQAMKKLEQAVHPLLARSRELFFEKAKKKQAKIVVLDIPLLFESSRKNNIDFTVVVSAPADMQRTRVLERPGMTEDKFHAILARQVPDEIKRQKADFIIDTGQGMDHAREQVKALIEKLLNKTS